MHAKCAVADGIWARVGSTNLNIASWFGNCELDAVIEDNRFAAEMEAMYERDLARTTEILLTKRGKMHAPGAPHRVGLSDARGRTTVNCLQSNLLAYEPRWNLIIAGMFNNSVGTSMDFPNRHRRMPGGRTWGPNYAGGPG